MKKLAKNPVLCLRPVPQTIVSCRDKEGRNNALVVGFTANVSLDPAMVMVGIVPSRYSHHMVKEDGCFVINLPKKSFQKEYAYLGSVSGKNEDKFETLGLKWENVDLENGTITIDRQMQYQDGLIKLVSPKTRNSIRTLALPQQAVDLLIAEHQKHPRNPYLFPSPKTGTMYDPDAFRRTHDKILKAIGAEHIRFHDLRHTFATLSLKSGVDVKTLSGALGHYSAGFTLNTYTHATAQMKQDAANTIGGVISQQMR